MIASIYKNSFQIDNPNFIPVDKCLDRISSGKSKTRVLKLRSEVEEEKRSEIKKGLPSVCFSGKFGNGRTDSSLIEHSGFLVLDFDKLDDVREKQVEIISYPFIYACWVSPSGNGLKALVKIADGSKHREHFEALRDIFPEVDKSGINPSRLCFESYDPDIYKSETSEVFTSIKETEVFISNTQYQEKDEDIFKKLVKWINSKGDFFVSGNRNNFVFKLASACCRFGIDELSSESLISGEAPIESGFTLKELNSTIKSAYKINKSRFASAEFKNEILVEKKSTREVFIQPSFVQSQVPSRIDISGDDFSFLAKPEDYEDYLQRVRTGTLEMGLTTGMPEMDKHFLFKSADLVVINGIDNVGKTKWILFLSIMSSILHGWKWIIYSSENSLGNVIRTLIEFYVGRKLDKITTEEYEEAKQFVELHYAIVKSEESLFNYRDMINISKKVLTIDKYHGFLIDPYNSLKIELTNSSKLSTHEYHYEAISELKMFGKKESLSIYINMHAVTSAIRQKDSDGYAMAPQKEDTEGGGKFSNKADSFITVHRKTQHPTDWMITEAYIRKIKEWETGGKPTPLNSPLRFKMNATGVGFSELNEMGTMYDPIEAWKKRNGKIIQNYFEPVTRWSPFKDDNNPIEF